MSEPLIQVRDPTRLHCLVMPSPRGGGMYAPPTRPATAPSAALTFPWMQPPLPPQPSAPYITGAAGGPRHFDGEVHAPPALGGLSHQHGVSDSECSILVPGWITPAGYAMCGLGLGLCNLLAPGYIQTCAHALSPAWTIALALHIIAHPARVGDSVWVWYGVLVLLLLPFVVLIAAPIFVAFYLIVFAAFASGFFWQRLQGAAFILGWVCWAGLLVSAGLGAGVGLPPEMHLCIAAFFSISLGVINSGGGKFIMHVA